MARPRRIRLERGDTLGGTAPLILLKKGDGKPFREGELRRRGRKHSRFKTSTIVWNVLIVVVLAAIVVALLGQGNGEGPFDRLMGITQSTEATTTPPAQNSAPQGDARPTPAPSQSD